MVAAAEPGAINTYAASRGWTTCACSAPAIPRSSYDLRSEEADGTQTEWISRKRPRRLVPVTEVLGRVVPAGAAKMLPQVLTTDTIDLEGNELRVIRIGRADTADSTVLHIPSLDAVVTGDLAYNEVHMMTAEAGEAERAEWIANLDKIAALNPHLRRRRPQEGRERQQSEDHRGIPAVSAGLLADRGRGNNSGRHCRQDGGTLSLMGQRPHDLAFRQISNFGEDS